MAGLVPAISFMTHGRAIVVGMPGARPGMTVQI
jgi:hypothetical protein